MHFFSLVESGAALSGKADLNKQRFELAGKPN